jgi:hypothetical protein
MTKGAAAWKSMITANPPGVRRLRSVSNLPLRLPPYPSSVGATTRVGS